MMIHCIIIRFIKFDSYRLPLANGPLDGVDSETCTRKHRGCRAMKTPRQPLPMTASEYLAETVYPTLEPALEAMLKAAFPADEKAAEGEEELPVLDSPLLWLVSLLT